MVATYAPMFLMILVASTLAFVFWLGATFLGGKLEKTSEKMMPFECGSDSSGGNHLKLSVKFYLTAILFVLNLLGAVALLFQGQIWQGIGGAILPVIGLALLFSERANAFFRS